MLISVTLYAAHTNQARLSLLKPLIKYNTPFSTEISTDSITVWEKLLEPELEEQQHYSLLFQLKLLTVRALITEGHFSLAIDKANSMYQKSERDELPARNSTFAASNRKYLLKFINAFSGNRIL